MFARSDDVNLAYAAANSVVTLTSPEDSVMVTKVGGGHNCWLSSNSTCADILTTWITNWAGELASSSGRQIELEPPTPRDPGSSKNFPADDGALFSTTVYPVLTGVGMLGLPLVGLGREAAAVLRGRSGQRCRRAEDRV